jgi:hypothetical protein
MAFRWGVIPHQEVIPLHVILPLSGSDARHYATLLRTVASGSGERGFMLEPHMQNDLRQLSTQITEAYRQAMLEQDERVRR